MLLLLYGFSRLMNMTPRQTQRRHTIRQPYKTSKSIQVNQQVHYHVNGHALLKLKPANSSNPLMLHDITIPLILWITEPNHQLLSTITSHHQSSSIQSVPWINIFQYISIFQHSPPWIHQIDGVLRLPKASQPHHALGAFFCVFLGTAAGTAAPGRVLRR